MVCTYVCTSVIERCLSTLFSVPEIIKATDDAADTIASEAGGFVASPSSIMFTNYLPGQTYTVSYKHCNSPCIQ